MSKQRFFAAMQAFGWHFFGSAVIACVAAAVVFNLLYPTPYAQMLGGFELFLLVMGVDVVCGPLLTLVLFNPSKPKRELMFDLATVTCLQLAALVYGLHTVWMARPVYLAYELDRLRVISLADLGSLDASKIPSQVSPPSWSGPSLIGIRIAEPSDADYLDELQFSLNGQDVAFRPDRWMPYGKLKASLLARSHPLSQLHDKHPEAQELIGTAVSKTGLAPEQLRWLPVQSRKGTGWTVLVDARDAAVVGWVQLDGF
jgi:hypothetical protein